MFKLILILFIFFYVFYKVGGFIMRALYFGSGRQYQQRQQYSQRTTSNARHEEIKVDYIPEDEVKKRKSSSGKKGGEYVDYEEVK
jgi:hypothetical protein